MGGELSKVLPPPNLPSHTLNMAQRRGLAGRAIPFSEAYVSGDATENKGPHHNAGLFHKQNRFVFPKANSIKRSLFSKAIDSNILPSSYFTHRKPPNRDSINTKSLKGRMGFGEGEEKLSPENFPSFPIFWLFLLSLLPCRVAAQQPERVAGVAELGEDAGELGLESRFVSRSAKKAYFQL